MIRLTLGLILLLFAAPAALAQESDWMAPAGNGTRPDRVVVYDFAVTPQDVKLDDGVVATIRRERPRLLGVFNSQPSADDQQLGIARSIADALADDLVDALQARGLRAARAAAAPAPTPATLVVQGQFASIDEGSKAQRVVIGFGAGSSKVKLLTQLGQNGTLLAHFDIDAGSGHKPGAVTALAGGPKTLAAAGGVRAVLEKTNPTLAKDVKAAADKLADRVVGIGRTQGWLKP